MPTYNECEPIVIFPLGIACQTVNPSNSTSSDGAATIVITGGTPPYNITWDIGNTTSTINNLSVGSYPVTVTDYYGDFTAKTNCVLSVIPPTPTPTPTPTEPPVPTYDLCMTINYSNPENGSSVYENIQFYPNGVVDGHQSWISEDENYTITWDTTNSVWTLNDYGPTIISSNPSYPPTNDWSILGYKGNITVIQGDCPNIDNIALNVSSNPTTCTSCDGSITLVGSGGIPPYQYSVDGGLTWVSNGIFQNLCPDVTFSVKVKDSIGTIYTPPVNNTILFPSVPVTTYTISLQFTNVNLSTTSTQTNYTINITPPLPVGVTVNFDLNLTTIFQRAPYYNSANSTFTSTVIKNGVPITSYENNTNESTITNPAIRCGGLIYKTNYLHTYQSLSITSGDVYVINTVASYQKTCNNGPIPLGLPEPTPTPAVVGMVDEYVGPGPLMYGTAAAASYACCFANVNQKDAYLTNTNIQGCVCCNLNNIGYYTKSLYE